MFRKIGKSKIAIVLAILFGISLFFFKGGSRYSNIFNSDNVVAKISGTPISTTKFNRTLQMNVNQFNQMLNKELTIDEIKNFNIHSLALSALVNDAVFENEFDNNNFKLDETVIALKTKERLPQIYNETGKINELYLNQFLKEQQLQIEDIVQIINFETRNSFFNEALFNINYPEYFTNVIQNYENHSRLIKLIEIPLELVKNDSAITNKENIKKYYNENIDLYKTKEKRDLEYILVKKDEYSENFYPSDFEIKDYYNNNKKIFYENEKRSFLQFNFKDLKNAKEFKEKIILLNDPEEIIKFANINNVDFNTFKNLEYDDLLESIGDILFKLDIDQQSEIFKTPLANHIIVLLDITEEYQKKLEDAKKEIASTILNVELNNYFEELKSTVSQAIIEGESLLKLSELLGVEIKKINSIDKNYSNFDEKEKDFFNSLITNAFSSNKDFVSNIISIDSDNFYLFNVAKIDNPKAIEFNIIRDTVENDFELSNKIETFNKNFIDNKKNKNFINEISLSYNKPINEIKVDPINTELSQKFISSIYKAEKNTNVYNLDGNLIQVAKIDDIIVPIKDLDVKKLSLLDNLRSELGSELFKNVKISTNDNLINAILDRY